MQQPFDDFGTHTGIALGKAQRLERQSKTNHGNGYRITDTGRVRPDQVLLKCGDIGRLDPCLGKLPDTRVDPVGRFSRGDRFFQPRMALPRGHPDAVRKTDPHPFRSQDPNLVEGQFRRFQFYFIHSWLPCNCRWTDTLRCRSGSQPPAGKVTRRIPAGHAHHRPPRAGRRR